VGSQYIAGQEAVLVCAPPRRPGCIERKQDDLPRFVVVPSAAARELALAERVTVDGTIGGVPFERRSIQPWGDGHYFVPVTQVDCAQGGFDVGDTVEFEVRVAKDELPDEFVRFLAPHPRARVLWNRLPPGARRQIAEDVHRAKRAAARERHARAWLERLC
jgi:hypothetical protein